MKNMYYSDMNRRFFLMSMSSLSLTKSLAEDFPTKSIKLIIPYAPGGATDILGRIIAQKMSDILGQAVIVDNKAGAGGNIGADFVAKSTPDGYTLVMGTIGTHAINSSLYTKMPFDPVKDFSPISLVLTNQLVLLVNPSLPIKTIDDLVSYSKMSNVRLNFGSAGNGSSHHLSSEMLKAKAGIVMEHIPYKGSAPALTDLMSGTIQVLFSDIAGALAYIKADRVRALAVGGLRRSSLLPELPTVAEGLKIPGFEVSAWMGILAPANTPNGVIEKLNLVLNKITKMQDVKERFFDLGAEPTGSSPQEFTDHIKLETLKWNQIVNQAKVKLS